MFEQSGHATILKDHQRRARQMRECNVQSDAVDGIVNNLSRVAEETGLPDVPDDIFDPAADTEVVAAIQQLHHAVAQASGQIRTAASQLEAAGASFSSAIDRSQFRTAVDSAAEAYSKLVENLRAGGVQDPSEYGRLMQDRQRLETQVGDLIGLEARLTELDEEAEGELREVKKLREKLTESRRVFLANTLKDNSYVRISVMPYGCPARDAEASLRRLVGREDGGFAEDLGFVEEVAVESQWEEKKSRLLAIRAGEQTPRDARLSNFLQRACQQQPDLPDRIAAWFPDDGLRVEYSPRADGTDFQDIRRGSPGQRATALLAFFLAQGQEPIVLDQPEDDLDNQVIYDLIVRQLREGKQHRQIIVVSHNPNVVVNGDAEMVHVMGVVHGQCKAVHSGCLQERDVRNAVCQVMEGGRDAFRRRYRRLAEEERNV